MAAGVAPTALRSPDLARPFAHRHQHDVHDADPPHQQADTDNARGDRGDPSSDGAKLVDELIDRRDLKRVWVVGVEPAHLSQDEADFTLGFFGEIGALDHAADPKEEFGVLLPSGDRKRHEDLRLRGADPKHRTLNRFDDADDLESASPEQNVLADRIGGKPKFFDRRLVDETDLPRI